MRTLNVSSRRIANYTDLDADRDRLCLLLQHREVARERPPRERRQHTSKQISHHELAAEALGLHDGLAIPAAVVLDQQRNFEDGDAADLTGALAREDGEPVALLSYVAPGISGSWPLPGMSEILYW